MINIPTARKTVQVSEESAPAVHMPMMVGNEMFVFSHQDVRRVEDIRYFSYNRMLPNGQLQPITNYGDRWIPDVQLGSLQSLMPQSIPHSPNNDIGTANSVPFSPTAQTAGISKQLEWTTGQKSLSCPPYPMHHTKTTSMTGIVVKPMTSNHEMQKVTNNGSCQTKPLTVSEGCNTSSTRIRSEPKAKVTFKPSPCICDDSDSTDNESTKSMVSSEFLMPPFCKRNQNYKKKTSNKRDR